MSEKDKARRSGPNPNMSLQDNSDTNETAINLQVSRLIQRCAISAAMAETLAPLVFQGARQ